MALSKKGIKDLIKDYIILSRKDGIGEGELRGIREEIVSATLLAELFQNHFKIDKGVDEKKFFAAKNFFIKNKEFLEEFSGILKDAISSNPKMGTKQIAEKFIDAKIFKGEVQDITKVVGAMVSYLKEAVRVADKALEKQRNEGEIKKALKTLVNEIRFRLLDCGTLFRIRRIGSALARTGVIEKKEILPLKHVLRDHYRKWKGQRK